MKYSDNVMGVLLLCSHLGLPSDGELKPFSVKEWNYFLNGILKLEEQPSVVFSENGEWMERLQYGEEEKKRIAKLLSRGGSLAFELDRLSGQGIRPVTLLDKEYPKLMRHRLKEKVPPVLYACGDMELVQKIGIGVVGSRNVDEEGIEFTKKLVRKASEERLMIYSGGAKGVDTISETTAIEAGSAVVAFLADSMTGRLKKTEVVKNISAGRLLLLSEVHPSAGFSAAMAMSRNKYIYASSYGTFVVRSDENKGGTWNGANESIKKGYTKTLVWDNKNYDGNQKLISAGGIPYELTEEKIYDIITRKDDATGMEGGNAREKRTEKEDTAKQLSLFGEDGILDSGIKS